MDAFAMSHHVFKETWRRFAGEKLDKAMQRNNVKDQYAVAIFQEEKKITGYLPLGKSRKFAKTLKSLKTATENGNLFMVMLSIRMMGWK